MPSRLDGIVQIFQGVADAIGIGDKPWGAGAVAIVVLGGFSPILVRNQKVSRARRLMTQAYASSSSTERNRLEEEAMGEVAGNADGLLVVAEIALQRGRLELARRAADELARTGKRVGELRRLRHKLDGDEPKTVDQAIVRVERLLGMGLRGEARERWAKARERWPDDPDLADLESRLP